MTFAGGLWLVAAVQIALAMTAMVYLVVVRLLRARKAARDESDVRQVRSFVVGLVAGSPADPLVMARLATDLPTTAHVLLEVGDLIRGGDRDRLFAQLDHGGVFAALEARALSARGDARLACVEALALFPGDAANDVLNLLVGDRQLGIRIAAAAGLVTRGGTIVLENLVTGLSHGDQSLSSRGREIIRRIVRDDPRAGVKALDRSDIGATLKGVLLEALGASGNYSLTPVIAPWARHPDAELRSQAVTALGVLRHPQAEKIIAEVLNDPVPLVRRCAARAVGQCRFEGQADALLPGLNDSHWSVRLETARALHLIGAAGMTRLREAAGTNSDPAVRHLAATMIAEFAIP